MKNNKPRSILGRPIVGKGNGTKIGPRKGSRKYILESLFVGQSYCFVGKKGTTAKQLMASISSTYRGKESIGQQGLTQSFLGLNIDACPVVSVTRISQPKK